MKKTSNKLTDVDHFRECCEQGIFLQQERTPVILEESIILTGACQECKTEYTVVYDMSYIEEKKS